MTTLDYLKLYFLTVPIFFGIDLLWLGVIAKGIYNKQLGHLMRTPPNWTVAIVFYLLFVVGILIFAVIPALNDNSLQRAVLWGALFGLFTYATYELTNWAVIKDWPVGLVFIDIVWGIVLSALVASLSFYLGQWLIK